MISNKKFKSILAYVEDLKEGEITRYSTSIDSLDYPCFVAFMGRLIKPMYSNIQLILYVNALPDKDKDSLESDIGTEVYTKTINYHNMYVTKKMSFVKAKTLIVKLLRETIGNIPMLELGGQVTDKAEFEENEKKKKNRRKKDLFN